MFNRSNNDNNFIQVKSILYIIVDKQLVVDSYFVILSKNIFDRYLLETLSNYLFSLDFYIFITFRHFHRCLPIFEL